MATLGTRRHLLSVVSFATKTIGLSSDAFMAAVPKQFGKTNECLVDRQLSRWDNWMFVTVIIMFKYRDKN